MQMDIHLFTYIRNTDYAMSVSFSLSQIEYTESEQYIKNLVDNNPEFKKAESDLSEAVCQIIGLAVKKHFVDEATEN